MMELTTPPNTASLPAGYQLQGTMDLKKDKKINLAIQAAFILIVLLMIGLARWFGFPAKGSWSTGITILATVLAGLFYMAVHELTHGFFMKALSGVKPVYFARFPFLCTGSTAYFNKGSFILVALAPVVLWGLVLITLLLLLPPDFFLSIYIVTGLNFAGAAGDYFQTYKIAELPPMTLIQDDGKVTSIFTKNA